MPRRRTTCSCPRRGTREPSAAMPPPPAPRGRRDAVLACALARDPGGERVTVRAQRVRERFAQVAAPAVDPDPEPGDRRAPVVGGARQPRLERTGAARE